MGRESGRTRSCGRSSAPASPYTAALQHSTAAYAFLAAEYFNPAQIQLDLVKSTSINFNPLKSVTVEVFNARNHL